MPERSFLSDIMRRIVRAGRRAEAPEGDVVTLCHDLIGDRGEASGLVRAEHILDLLDATPKAELGGVFARLATEFGVDDERLQTAIDGWSPGDTDGARALHFAAEPKSQDLIRILNRTPGATTRLVNLRAALLDCLREDPSLKGLDSDFQHLFSSWFNRGFLEIRRIDWSTSASVLEKIIAYEAVHEIAGWDDLRQRVGAPDRRLFAFFHPAMPSEPLIFVEVALTTGTPDAIAPILEADRAPIDAHQATTAVFYSISNCQKGLRGVSFGNFLIKQVAAELQRELPDLATFVTLSPVPGFRKWAEACAAADAAGCPLTEQEREAVASLAHDDRPAPELAARLAARYLTTARRAKGGALDPVAHFHLGNGAVLHRVHADADLSAQGQRASWGVMVNYLYDAPRIEANHQAYATAHDIAASPEVRALASR